MRSFSLRESVSSLFSFPLWENGAFGSSISIVPFLRVSPFPPKLSQRSIVSSSAPLSFPWLPSKKRITLVVTEGQQVSWTKAAFEAPAHAFSRSFFKTHGGLLILSFSNSRNVHFASHALVAFMDRNCEGCANGRDKLVRRINVVDWNKFVVYVR